MSSYRLIALIAILSKILEKVIYDSVYSFLENNKMSADEQTGFRKN